MWLLVLALAGLPQIARMIAHVWFVHTRHVLDHAVPDDLPMTAGEWLADKLRALSLADRLRIVVTDHVTSSKDAFHVQRGVIQLTAETNFKRDPVYWAIAAHELGHARFRLAHPVSLTLEMIADAVKTALIRFALGLVIGNLLFAIPRATQLAHWMLGAAIVLHVVELYDEVVASAFAMRALRAEPALSAVHLRAARSALVAAFLTYLLPFLAYIVLFSQWWLVEAVTQVARHPSGGVTAVGYIGAALASAYIVLYAAIHLLGALRAPKVLHIDNAILGAAWTLSVAALIWVGWDRHPTATHAWYVMLACSAVQAAVVAIIATPSAIVLSPLVKWARKYDRGIEISSAFTAAKRAGAQVTKAGNDWLKTALRDRGAPVSAVRRIWELTRLAVFPLLIAFWF